LTLSPFKFLQPSPLNLPRSGFRKFFHNCNLVRAFIGCHIFVALEQIVFILNHFVVKYEYVNLLVLNGVEGDSRLNRDRKAIQIKSIAL